jgi:hypothetical protein
MARVGMSRFGPIRLTLDRDLRALPVRHAAFENEQPGLLVSGERLILELKFRYGMPALFKELVEDFRLIEVPLSKYRWAAAELGLVRGQGACLRF